MISDDAGKLPHSIGSESSHPRSESPVVQLAISSLLPADSPRLQGLDPGHVRALAEIEDGLPPILVHRSTMRVIDGMHRLRAAQLNGRDTIDVQFFEGSQEETFLLAVRANVAHGLPLTLADRRAAARRVVQSHPQMSDRSIATITGLAAKTVAAIRRSTAEYPQLNARIGQDGRVRPVDGAEGRRLAERVLAAHPGAPLRMIAREAGVSLGTAQDVRRRVQLGQDPAPDDQRPPATRSGPPGRAPAQPERVDLQSILDSLRRDPSLRYKESGRSFLRWLGLRMILSVEWRRAVNIISPHSAILVSKVARECATSWTEFAEELERRSSEYT